MRRWYRSYVGELNERGTVKKPVRTADTFGSYTETFDFLATVWMAATPLKGSEYYEAQRVQSKITHKITMRYRTDVKADMVIDLRDGRRFKIISPPREVQKRQYVEFRCEEITDES